jgi:hypothetical protein
MRWSSSKCYDCFAELTVQVCTQTAQNHENQIIHQQIGDYVQTSNPISQCLRGQIAM